MFYYNHCQRKLGRNSLLWFHSSPYPLPTTKSFAFSVSMYSLKLRKKLVIGSFSNHNKFVFPKFVELLLWNSSFMSLWSHLSPFLSTELHSDFHQQIDQDQEYHDHLAVHYSWCHGSQPPLFLPSAYQHSSDWCTQQPGLEGYYGDLTQCWELMKQFL